MYTNSTHPHVKDTPGVRDSVHVGLRITAAAANMEANTNHIQLQFLGPLKETPASFKLCPKLHTQAAHCL